MYTCTWFPFHPLLPSSSTFSPLQARVCYFFNFISALGWGMAAVILTYSLFKFMKKNTVTDNDFCWIKWNSVGRQTSQHVIPTDPKQTFLFISDVLWAWRKDLVQSASGFCSVQSVIFFPLLPTAISLTLLKGLFS